MTKRLFTLAAIFCLPAVSHGTSWIENDYAFGSGKFRRESLTFFSRIAPAVAGGLNASFYKDGGPYRDKVFSFRTPVMYSGRKFALSLKPFVYPASSDIKSSAQGAKLNATLPLAEGEDGGYTHLTISGAAARQRTTLLDPVNGTGRRSFSESAFEAQIEKSFYNQFFFLASAAGFAKPEKARRANLVNPAMDHGELAYLGTFRQITALPEWTAAVQFARDMAPEFDSHLYAGYSRISFRDAVDANSLIGGIKMRLNEKSTLDFACNFYKINGETGRNYYKLFVQIFF